MRVAELVVSPLARRSSSSVLRVVKIRHEGSTDSGPYDAGAVTEVLQATFDDGRKLAWSAQGQPPGGHHRLSRNRDRAAFAGDPS